jgi:hypothetical protein
MAEGDLGKYVKYKIDQSVWGDAASVSEGVRLAAVVRWILECHQLGPHQAHRFAMRPEAVSQLSGIQKDYDAWTTESRGETLTPVIRAMALMLHGGKLKIDNGTRFARQTGSHTVRKAIQGQLDSKLERNTCLVSLLSDTGPIERSLGICVEATEYFILDMTCGVVVSAGQVEDPRFTQVIQDVLNGSDAKSGYVYPARYEGQKAIEEPAAKSQIPGRHAPFAPPAAFGMPTRTNSVPGAPPAGFGPPGSPPSPGSTRIPGFPPKPGVGGR